MFFEDSGTKGTNAIEIDANKRYNEFARRCVFSHHPISIVKSIFYRIKIQIIMTSQTIQIKY